jgi:bifunctional DNA-binding transcriptional regulator/antitoxin component of YhaV-PrlF toxin-antitoxin module
MISRLTKKFRVRLPREVRKALKLRRGEYAAFEIQPDGSVLLRKARKVDEVWMSWTDETVSANPGEGVGASTKG